MMRRLAILLLLLALPAPARAGDAARAERDPIVWFFLWQHTPLVTERIGPFPTKEACEKFRNLVIRGITGDPYALRQLDEREIHDAGGKVTSSCFSGPSYNEPY
jgi:hypothetical protein